MSKSPGKKHKIGEAAEQLGLEPYVLRFWESEFHQLRPERTFRGQRLYSEADMLLLRRIKHLLHERGMTIEGARRLLDQKQEYGEILALVERELTEIRKRLREERDEG
ncbi:MAG: MerR family transcriptional regulator [Desulfohalobiaceae bacterium]